VPHLLNALRGFLMGSADVVPGVSGGTVALVLGIYERLVRQIRSGAGALSSFVRLRWAEGRERFVAVDWRFLLPLLAGIALAIVSLAALIEHLLDEEPQNTAAAFFGLVAGSIVIAWRLVRSWNAAIVALGAAVAVAAFFLLGLRGDEVADPALGLFLGAGSIAIVAMILPGISGSFILLMLGMYQPVLDAVNDRSADVIVVFAVGAVIGLALFSTLLDRLLRDHHDAVMAALVGLMTGSMRVLWPWPDGADTARLGSPEDPLVPALLALTGLALVLTVGIVAIRGGEDAAVPIDDRSR
jgi:putative membrane protein